MRVEYMREFLVVAEEGSISLAAQRLRSTQPVLSKHIRMIEDGLGKQLFFRSTKGISLTSQGKVAFEIFEKIVALNDELAERMAADVADLCGEIRVGILTMGFDRYMGPLVRSFRETHPNVSFSFSTRQPRQIMNGIIDGSLDMGFLGEIALENRAQFSFHCIGRESIHFLVAKDGELGGKSALAPKDAENRPLVCLDTKETTDALNSIVFAAGFHPSELIAVNEIEIAPQAVILADGYFAIPDFMCGVFGTYADVVVIDAAEPLILPLYLISREGSRNPLVSAFLEWVEAHWAIDEGGVKAKNT